MATDSPLDASSSASAAILPDEQHAGGRGRRGHRRGGHRSRRGARLRAGRSRRSRPRSREWHRASHQLPQLRGYSRRHLLPARLPQGRYLCPGTGSALRVLRGARDSTRAGRQADRRDQRAGDPCADGAQDFGRGQRRARPGDALRQRGQRARAGGVLRGRSLLTIDRYRGQPRADDGASPRCRGPRGADRALGTRAFRPGLRPRRRAHRGRRRARGGAVPVGGELRRPVGAGRQPAHRGRQGFEHSAEVLREGSLLRHARTLSFPPSRLSGSDSRRTRHAPDARPRGAGAFRSGRRVGFRRRLRLR